MVFLSQITMKNLFKLLFIFVILLSNGSKSKANQPKLRNFYAVTGNGLNDTSWLFGTYHLVKSNYLDEVPVVVHAFNQSNVVVV